MLFDELFALLGKRFDDPSVMAFHERHGLAPAPVIFATGVKFPVKHPRDGYSVNYSAELKREGTYPPRREGGRYIGYVSSVTLKSSFAEPFAGFTVATPEAAAKKVASQSVATGMFLIHTVHTSENGQVKLVYDEDEEGNPLHEVRLVPTAMDDDDPRLETLAAAAKLTPRALPKNIGPAAKAGMPKLLDKLREIRDDEGLGEVDLELYDTFQTGSPERWTGNPAAEEHLRVFGADGSGSLVAFWLVNAGKPLEDQPIVFLGSEGKLGAVAKNLSDFAVELADGVGPMEFLEYGTSAGEPNAAVRAIADESGGRGRRAIDALLEASALYEDFEVTLRSLITY